MSLRLRLSLTLGAAFALIWALAAAWMLSDLRNQMMFSLDQRLVASARMVAGLMEQLPALPTKGEGTHFSAEQLNIPGGMACQVSCCAAKSWPAVTPIRSKLWRPRKWASTIR